jgi:lipid A ethanolaminephosphotransferase
VFKTLPASQSDTLAGPDFRRSNKRPRIPNLPPVSSELVIVAASLYFSIFCNQPLWFAMFSGRDWSSASSWLFASSIFIIVTAIHSLLLGLLVNRWTAKPVLVLLLPLSAVAAYYMQHYKVFFDATMLRNVFHTDVKEASELLAVDMFVSVFLYGLLPAVLVMRLDVVKRPLRRAVLLRSGFLLGCTVLIFGGIGLIFQDLAATMRNQKEVRYLITPANLLVSSMRVLASDVADANATRKPVGTDAALAASWARHSKPALLVVVVGETVRAANWGLNGYERQTTPGLAASDVINYPRVSACGTNTEVSLPCMFSPFGRKAYDEKKIRQHESLLHVLEHGGFKTVWLDNQSGCKGVCDGLEQQQIDGRQHTALCDGERCLDEILLEKLDAEIKQTKRNTVVVLHQLGNHGPAYSRRYPESYRRFTPTCDTGDLGKCSRLQIINSYDNAVLYTDHVLQEAIQRLKAQTSYDAAMIYVSDHGESLGEKGFYLHGLPYAIAPKEQTDVPMVMWLSTGFASSFNLDTGCLKQQASRPLSHDHLFHSILGLLQVTTQVYDKSYDLTSTCRG